MNILLPLETLSRELDYKLVLAHNLVSSNTVDAFIGSVPAIHSNIEYFEGGLYFGKTVFTQVDEEHNKNFYKRLKSKGYDIGYMHEEGAIWAGGVKDWNSMLIQMYDLNIFDDKDLILLWGEFQKKLEEKRNSKNIPLHVVGSPRFDIIQKYPYIYEKEVLALKERFGDFILINGKYAMANHGQNFHKLTEEIIRHPGDFNENQKKFYSNITSIAIKMFKMVELVLNCALDFPKLNFVFRPHPSEGLDFYNDIFSRVENVYVVREGSANPFILASLAMIHDGCTTALEAVNSGRPIINYRAFTDKFDEYLPSQIGYDAESIQDVINYIHQIDTSKSYTYSNELGELALSLVENLSDTDSFEKVNQLVSEYLVSRNGEPSSYPSRKEIRQWYIKRYLKINGALIKNRITGNANKLQRDQYLLGKFGGLDKNDLVYKLDQLNRHCTTKVKLEFYNPEIVRIYK